MIGNLEDYKYFVDQGELWTDHSRLDENITHVVLKGIFMQDDDTGVDDIVLSLCGLYHYTADKIMGEFDVDWFNSWVETGACEKCFKVVTKREFQKWLVDESEGAKEIRKDLKKYLEEQEK